MKTHTSRGSEILMELSGVQNLAYYDYCYDICRHHHERWDGGGYPDGLVGNFRPLNDDDMRAVYELACEGSDC